MKIYMHILFFLFFFFYFVYRQRQPQNVPELIDNMLNMNYGLNYRASQAKKFCSVQLNNDDLTMLNSINSYRDVVGCISDINQNIKKLQQMRDLLSMVPYLSNEQPDFTQFSAFVLGFDPHYRFIIFGSTESLIRGMANVWNLYTDKLQCDDIKLNEDDCMMLDDDDINNNHNNNNNIHHNIKAPLYDYKKGFCYHIGDGTWIKMLLGGHLRVFQQLFVISSIIKSYSIERQSRCFPFLWIPMVKRTKKMYIAVFRKIGSVSFLC